MSPEQDGAAFRLPGVAWDAWILLDDRGSEGVVAGLLEWQTPRPTGAPPAAANVLGHSRLGLTTGDLDGVHARLRAAGATCFGEPHCVALESVLPIRALTCLDPDGTVLELIE